MTCYSLTHDANTHLISNQDYEKFYDNSLYSFPGDKKVLEIFLANFVRKQPYCDVEMETIAGTNKMITLVK